MNITRHGVNSKPPLKFTLEPPRVDYSATTSPGGQIWN